MQYWIAVCLLMVVHCSFSIGVAFASDTAGRQKQDAIAVCSLNPCAIDLVMDRQGTVYAANSESGKVVAVSPGETPRKLASILGVITAMTVDRRRAVCVAVQDGRIFRVVPDGRVSLVYRVDGVPVALSVDRDGGLVVLLDGSRIAWVPFDHLVAEE